MARIKKALAKKICNKPEDLSHKYYELENLVVLWKAEGIDEDELRQRVTKYIEDERTRCFNDPIYFANTWGFIIGHGATGIIPFDAAEYQKELLTGARENKYTIAVKSRQLGVSTVVMFYCLWYSIFSSGKKTLIVAHRRESAEEFIYKLKTAYELLPAWLKPGCIQYSKSTVEFETKSAIRAMTSSPNAARSFSATLFVIDEAAFIENAHEVVKAIMPTVAAADGKIVAISSPNGNSEANWFYKTYTMAESEGNGWTWFNFPWQVSPVFSKNPRFREEQIRLDNGNVEKFEQEYECKFDINLSCFFKQDALKAFVPDSQILNRNFGGNTYEDTFWIWNVAEPGRKYTIGVDCASNKSTARDYSSFQVIADDTQEQVAEYIGKLPTEVFVDILIRTAKHYNNAQLNVEENSYSQVVFYLLQERGYMNLWTAHNKQTPGFNTNKHSRVLLLEKLALFYNNPFYSARLKSVRLKMQMENFSAVSVYADGSAKYEAKSGNDDAIFALGLALLDMTPIEFSARPTTGETGVAFSTTGILSSNEYPDDYLEYYSAKMGISVSALKAKLQLYHDIKQGVYADSGIEDIPLEHPVVEWEKQQSTADFLGIRTDSTLELSDDILGVISKKNSKTFDLFDPELSAIRNFHDDFFVNGKRNWWN